jgi:hypothetical protein
MTRELVVAVYNENISWLEKRNYIEEKISAYNKFTRFDYQYVEQLENEGRESHTYIHHIIKNYDNLSDFTMFVQGYPFDHFFGIPDNFNIGIFYLETAPVHDYHPFGEMIACDQKGRPLSRWNIDLKTIWEELFCDPMPQIFLANYGAQFVVSKDLIRSRSFDFWKKALELHYKYVFTPWAFEILWYTIFDPRFKAIL